MGKGAAKIDLRQLGAVAAYTVDSDGRGKIDNETFSSDVAIVEINGVRIHTGFAKGKLVNSLRLAAKFIARLPMEIAPETTSGREGFIHVSKIAGDVGFTSIRLWISDFEGEGLAAKRALVEQLVAELRATEPRAQITVKFQVQVRNPRAGIERDPRTLAFAQEAMRRAGIEPKLAIIRGGTDGSEVTARGLPTPNLSAGTHEFRARVRERAGHDLRRASPRPPRSGVARTRNGTEETLRRTPEILQESAAAPSCRLAALASLFRSHP